MVATDKAADTGCDMDPGTGIHGKPEVASLGIDSFTYGGDEGCASKLAYRQAEQQVVHGSIAAHADVDNVMPRGANGVTQVVGQRIDSLQGGFAQLISGNCASYRIVDATDEVGAPGCLRIFDAQAGQAHAAFQIDQEAGYVRRPKIHGEA